MSDCDFVRILGLKVIFFFISLFFQIFWVMKSFKKKKEGKSNVLLLLVRSSWFPWKVLSCFSVQGQRPSPGPPHPSLVSPFQPTVHPASEAITGFPHLCYHHKNPCGLPFFFSFTWEPTPAPDLPLHERVTTHSFQPLPKRLPLQLASSDTSLGSQQRGGGSPPENIYSLAHTVFL